MQRSLKGVTYWEVTENTGFSSDEDTPPLRFPLYPRVSSPHTSHYNAICDRKTSSNQCSTLETLVNFSLLYLYRITEVEEKLIMSLFYNQDFHFYSNSKVEILNLRWKISVVHKN